jgi:hypothetical protein
MRFEPAAEVGLGLKIQLRFGEDLDPREGESVDCLLLTWQNRSQTALQ